MSAYIGYIQLVASIGVVVCGVLLVRHVDWAVVGNRALHWIAAIGVFLLFDAIGVQKLFAAYVRSVGTSL